MKKKSTRSIEITFEKSEEYIVRHRRQIDRAWCSLCGHEVRMSNPEDAARITGISTRKIYSEIEAGIIHFAESADGLLMVCHRSLTEADPIREAIERA